VNGTMDWSGLWTEPWTNVEWTVEKSGPGWIVYQSGPSTRAVRKWSGPWNGLNPRPEWNMDWNRLLTGVECTFDRPKCIVGKLASTIPTVCVLHICARLAHIWVAPNIYHGLAKCSFEQHKQTRCIPADSSWTSRSRQMQSS